MAGRIKIAVDTGGTFTDICLLNEDAGELSVTKVSSTPDNPALAVIAFARYILEVLSIRLFTAGKTWRLASLYGGPRLWSRTTRQPCFIQVWRASATGTEI